MVLWACGSPSPEPVHPATGPAADVQGDTIVYAAPVGDAWELFTFDLGDPNPQQLTSLSQVSGFPVWSPGGDRIAFVAMSEALVLWKR